MTATQTPARPARPRLLAAVLFVLALLAVTVFLFHRHAVLDADGMDIVQAARLLARTGKLSTHIVRPLLTARLSVNGDGTAPDFAHAPLYAGLLAGALRATHQTGADQGEQTAVLVNLALYLAATAATYLLAHCLFAARPWGRAAAVVGALFFALGGAAPSAAVTVQPALLGALLFALLLATLWGMNGGAESETVEASPSALRRLGRAGVAGALFGLLFLSLYSALLLLPALLIYVYLSGGGRQPGSHGLNGCLAFVAAALLIAAPLLVRNFRLAHNPFYNAHLIDLMSDTPSFPGSGLTGVAVLPRSLSQFLAHGGLGEIVGKLARNLAVAVAATPSTLGLLVTPLFLIGALTRFPDRRVVRLRTLLYLCLGCQAVGMAPFGPAAQSAQALLIFAPPAAALAAGLLLSLIQVRRLPDFYARATIAGWTVIGCLPGLFHVAAAPPSLSTSARDYHVFAALNAEPRGVVLLRASGTYLVTDAPEAASYRLDLPILALPGDAGDMRTVEERTGRAVGAILLTPAIGHTDPADPSTALWRQTYDQIVALNTVAARLDARLRQPVVQSTHLFYPEALAPGMRGFGAAKPFAENGGEESLLFLSPEAIHGAIDETSLGMPSGTSALFPP